MSVVIRNASWRDAASVRSVAVVSRIDAWTADQYRNEADRSDAVFLTAVQSSEIMGFISGRIVPSTIEGMDGEIYNIAVSPRSRKKGIGRNLLANAIERFVSLECNSIWLEVRESNFTGIQFYENNGFRRIMTRRNFYTRPVEDAIVMRLTLVG